MANTDLYKKRRWEIFLITFSCILTAASSLAVIFLSPKEHSTKKISPIVINNTNSQANIPQQVNSSGKKQAPDQRKTTTIDREKEAPVTSAKYVEIYLNINSNDQVLINGKPAAPDEISAQPNTLKLIAGNRYTIKINNCPEKEIVPTQNMTLSTCM